MKRLMVMPNNQISERRKSTTRTFLRTFFLVVLLVLAVVDIVYVAKTCSGLKGQVELKKHNEKCFNNLDVEQISALKGRSLFNKRETKDNSVFLREIGPIPKGKFISSFSEVGEASYEYMQEYVAYRNRLAYYTVRVPRRDYFGFIEYDEEERSKIVKEPY